MNRFLTGLTAAAAMAAALPATALPPGDAAAGEAKASACQGCHGPDVNNPAFPKIAGQHPGYLFHALKAYKSGARQNAIMQGQVSGLSESDMADLATYFSTLEGELTTVSRE